MLDEPSRSVGVHRNTKPVITEIPILPGTILVVYTDGLSHAGSLSGNKSYDPVAATRHMIFGEGITEARILADRLLAEANEMDNGRPRDDISVLVVSVQPTSQQDDVRRMDVSLPI